MCIRDSYYSRTSNFTAYQTLQQCLDSGGRLPKSSKAGMQIHSQPKVQPNVEKYSRGKFGKGWSEGENSEDCLNTRHEILSELSTSTVKTDKTKCRVTSGKWYDPYTGKHFYNARNMDVDHVVPLAFSWKHGASSWSEAKRVRFANDMANLVPVDASANRQKGAKPPWEWMPSNQQYSCQYLLRFTRIVKSYRLNLSSDEHLKLKDLYQQHSCRTPQGF